MDINETLESIYGWVSNINNAVMRVEAKAERSLTLLKGDNGHGIVAMVDKLVSRGEDYEKWAREHLENRATTCPIATEIEAIRADMQARDKALVEAATARRDTRTKLLIAGIGASGVVLGGAGKAIIDLLARSAGGG